MDSFFRSIGQNLSYILDIGLWDVVDILLVAAGIFFVICLIRRNHMNRVVQGVIIILLLLWLSDALHLYTVHYILSHTVELGVLALVIIFQPELRRLLEKLGTGGSISRIWGSGDSAGLDAAITQTVLACTELAASRTGALLIFERDNRLDEQIRTGTVIDAETTSELIRNLFFVNSPLHDGAVIVRGGRLYAAGCMLPLSGNNNLSKELGMRHRAGIGMSEVSDALVVIVSEETGTISVAIDGTLKRHLSADMLDMQLRSGLSGEDRQPGDRLSGLKRFLRKGVGDE